MGDVVRLPPPCVRIVPGERLTRVLQLGHQKLLPSMDRRNVVELRIVRAERAYLAWLREARAGKRPDNPCGQL